jgi:hypothetical protein
MLTEQLTGAAPRERVGQAWFDWAMVALCAWYLGGLYVDGWAHNHDRVDDTFFTPWHALFYSGFGAVALLIGLAVARGVLAGRGWRAALPRGYELALIGAPLFALGGVGDLLWHEAFGIESGVEALLSPTHLLLAAGMGMLLSAPLRANTAPLPALLSLAFTYSLATFLTQFGHPFVHLMARETRYGDAGDALGVSGIVIQSALLVGALLLWLRARPPLPGGFTLLLTLNAALMSVLEDRYWAIPVALVAGAAADLLAAALRPAPDRPRAMRIFACAVPAILYLCYFIGLTQATRIVWSIHLWAGSIVMAGFVGFLLSLLATPGLGGARSE